VIDSPVQGTYTVEVTAVSIVESEGAQMYSFVVLGGVDSISDVTPPPPSDDSSSPPDVVSLGL